VRQILLANRGAEFEQLGADRRFQPGERKIQVAAVQQRPREVEGGGITERRQAGQRWSAGIAQPHQLGRLVEGFAGRVVDGFAQQFVMPDVVDAHQLGVSARHQQGNEREVGGITGQERRQQVTFEVVHTQHRSIQGRPEGTGHPGPDQQRAGQPGPAGVGDDIDRAQRQAGLGKHLAGQGDDPSDVVA